MAKKKKSKDAVEPEEVETSQVETEVDEATGDSEPEAYQALYRRFRPTQFADVFGQEGTTTALVNTVVEKKLAHAYLFTGPRGTGKTTTARIFAAAINCENLGKDGEPCQKCNSCYGVARGDGGLGVVEYDAASNRSVDGIRSIISQTRTASALSKNKVFIIDEVHALTNDAITAFLKTLEEPPPGVIFILCTTDPQKVLPTIKSRTAQFKFNLVDAKIMTELVRGVADQASIKINDAQIKQVVSQGKGSPRDTLSALESVAMGGSSTHDDYPAKISQAIADASVSDIILTVADAVANGVDLAAFTYDCLSHWRDCIIALQAPDLLAVTDERFDEILRDAEHIKLSRLFRLVQTVSEALGKMGYSGDPRILLEVTLIQIIKPDTDTRTLNAISEQLQEIREELSVVASGVRGGGALASPGWELPDAPTGQSRAAEKPSERDDDRDESPAEAEPVTKAKGRKKIQKEEPEPTSEESETPEADEPDDEPEAKSEDVSDDLQDKPLEDILEDMIEDAPKRVKLILQGAFLDKEETTAERFVLETKPISEAVYDTIAGLVRKHAQGRKLKHYEKDE